MERCGTFGEMQNCWTNGLRPQWTSSWRLSPISVTFVLLELLRSGHYFELTRFGQMDKLRTTAVFVAALLVTVSVSVIASANISPQSLNAPSRNEGAELNNIGAQKPIVGAHYISGGDDVCLPHIPNAPRRRGKLAPR